MPERETTLLLFVAEAATGSAVGERAGTKTRRAVIAAANPLLTRCFDSISKTKKAENSND
jgi:hypothetical protein